MKTLAITCADTNCLQELKDTGADEVIVSLRNSAFSALTEMDEKEIVECGKKAHEIGMKVSVMMNRLFPESEVKEAVKKSQYVFIYLGNNDISYGTNIGSIGEINDN